MCNKTENKPSCEFTCTCDLSQEREFMENLLNQRFNFLLVFFSLVIAGALAARSHDQAVLVLQVGAVQVGIVKWIEETLSLTGFLLLEDDKGFFAVSQSALIVDRDLLALYPEIKAIETELSPLLTTETMHSLVSRVRLMYRDPTEVAREFLLKEGLITW